MQTQPNRHGGIFIAMALASMLAGCATQQRPIVAPVNTASSQSSKPAENTRTAALQRLVDEAAALMPLATSDLAKRFLRATDGLPSVATRTAFRDDNTREFFSPTEATALPAARREKLAALELDEYRYYFTKYGTPLAYVRALDLAATHGFTEPKSAHILDFGYGSIGHLRLLASLGAHTVGVDPDSYLGALYRERSDQGVVAPARGIYRGTPGTVTLAHGRWPKDAAIAELVTRGGPYQLILSKNTLKRGYLRPERRANKNQLIDLGVTDDAFLKSVYQVLAPGGLMVIYNLAPKQSANDKPFLPQADARSPFTREQFIKAGFTITAFDAEDHAFVRRMGLAAGWDKNDKGEVVNDLSANLFAMFTIVARPL